MEELLKLFGLMDDIKAPRSRMTAFPHSRSRAQQVAESLKREKAIARRNKRKAAKRSNKGNQHRS